MREGPGSCQLRFPVRLLSACVGGLFVRAKDPISCPMLRG